MTSTMNNYGGSQGVLAALEVSGPRLSANSGRPFPRPSKSFNSPARLTGSAAPPMSYGGFSRLSQPNSRFSRSGCVEPAGSPNVLGLEIPDALPEENTKPGPGFSQRQPCLEARQSSRVDVANSAGSGWMDSVPSSHSYIARRTSGTNISFTGTDILLPLGSSIAPPARSNSTRNTLRPLSSSQSRSCPSGSLVSPRRSENFLVSASASTVPPIALTPLPRISASYRPRPGFRVSDAGHDGSTLLTDPKQDLGAGLPGAPGEVPQGQGAGNNNAVAMKATMGNSPGSTSRAYSLRHSSQPCLAFALHLNQPVSLCDFYEALGTQGALSEPFDADDSLMTSELVSMADTFSPGDLENDELSLESSPFHAAPRFPWNASSSSERSACPSSGSLPASSRPSSTALFTPSGLLMAKNGLRHKPPSHVEMPPPDTLGTNGSPPSLAGGFLSGEETCTDALVRHCHAGSGSGSARRQLVGDGWTAVSVGPEIVVAVQGQSQRPQTQRLDTPPAELPAAPPARGARGNANSGTAGESIAEEKVGGVSIISQSVKSIKRFVGAVVDQIVGGNEGDKGKSAVGRGGPKKKHNTPNGLLTSKNVVRGGSFGSVPSSSSGGDKSKGLNHADNQGGSLRRGERGQNVPSKGGKKEKDVSPRGRRGQKGAAHVDTAVHPSSLLDSREVPMTGVSSDDREFVDSDGDEMEDEDHEAGDRTIVVPQREEEEEDEKTSTTRASRFGRIFGSVLGLRKDDTDDEQALAELTGRKSSVLTQMRMSFPSRRSFTSKGNASVPSPGPNATQALRASEERRAFVKGKLGVTAEDPRAVSVSPLTAQTNQTTTFLEDLTQHYAQSLNLLDELEKLVDASARPAPAVPAAAVATPAFRITGSYRTAKQCDSILERRPSMRRGLSTSAAVSTFDFTGLCDKGAPFLGSRPSVPAAKFHCAEDFSVSPNTRHEREISLPRRASTMCFSTNEHLLRSGSSRLSPRMTDVGMISSPSSTLPMAQKHQIFANRANVANANSITIGGGALSRSQKGSVEFLSQGSQNFITSAPGASYLRPGADDGSAIGHLVPSPASILRTRLQDASFAAAAHDVVATGAGGGACTRALQPQPGSGAAERDGLGAGNFRVSWGGNGEGATSGEEQKSQSLADVPISNNMAGKLPNSDDSDVDGLREYGHHLVSSAFQGRLSRSAAQSCEKMRPGEGGDAGMGASVKSVPPAVPKLFSIGTARARGVQRRR